MGRREAGDSLRCASIDIGTVVNWAPESAQHVSVLTRGVFNDVLGIGKDRVEYAALSRETVRGSVGLGWAALTSQPA